MTNTLIPRSELLDPARFVDLDIGSEEVRQLVFKGLCAKWATEPPFYILEMDVPHVIVGRFNDVQDVLRDREGFVAIPPKLPGYERFDRFFGMAGLAGEEGEDHDRIKRLMMPLFLPKVLRKFLDRIGEIVDTMFDEVEEQKGREFDFINDFANHLVVRVLLDGMLGLNQAQQESFAHMHDLLPLLANIGPGEAPPQEFLDAQAHVVSVSQELLDERRRDPREHDWITTMVEAHDRDGAMTEPEIFSILFATLAGGLGTTSTSTTAMVVNLIRHRDQFNEVIADRGLVAGTVDESLRYQGPGFLGFGRFATADCEVGGLPVLAGMPVLTALQSANYDPDVFPDPLRFDIHRNPKNILTFGAGSHMCVGNVLARYILQIVLGRVCDRFPNIDLQDPDYDPVYRGMFGEVMHVNAPMVTGN
ncbi:cytochrome P450 [Mycobacterium sp. URHB0044]|jgi:cytochrome P450|uniref:cytochrome P450 n=1 Tax=Mycobacterium sp. URHB0044 TaxID=1380386 RepID=UPI000491128E|nr:cytochrome P450 [Mycobacterium sp. URHB0044]